MAIRTQQPQVSGICLPVLESAGPCVLLIARPDFFAAVDVVDIKRTVIREATLDALPTKIPHQRELAFPEAPRLVRSVAVLIPVGLLASVGAKTVRALLAAFLALAFVAPSVGEVALPPAEPACPVLQSVGVHLVFAAAMGALHINGFRSHIEIIPHAEPRYFDIACRRIDDAYRQGKLFEEPRSNKQTQESLL